MKPEDKQSAAAAMLAQNVIPIMLFIAGVGVLYFKVDAIGMQQAEHTTSINKLVERMAVMETKVEILYSDRKK